MEFKLVAFLFKGVLKKSCFIDNHSDICYTELGHIEWNVFLILCKIPHGRFEMVIVMIQNGLVNIALHPTLVQSSKSIMTLAQHYVPNEKLVRRITREMVLDLRPNNIEKVFHLPTLDSFYGITYESFDM